MKAAVFHGIDDLRVEDVPEPEAGPGQVKLRVPTAGICGSDLHVLYDGLAAPIDAPHPRTGVQVPVILGHEFGGYVLDAGDDVEGLAEGELVAVNPLLFCGECVACRAGHGAGCETIVVHGINTGSGGFSPYTVVEREQIVKLPPGFTEQQAALVEPLATGYHAADRGNMESGETAVVHGAGPIGVAVYLTLRAKGVEVIVSEPSARRREALRALGAEHLLDPSSEDVVARVRELTEGRGAEASFDAAGVQPAFDAAVRTTAIKGRVVVVAIYMGSVDFSVMEAAFPEMEVTGSVAYTAEDWPATIEGIAAGHYPIDERWVSAVGIEEIVSGFEAAHEGREMKVLVDQTGGNDVL